MSPSYDDLETSRAGGEPVELFKFNMLGLTWRYTSSDQPVTFMGQLYQPERIVREPVDYGREAATAGLALKLPRENPVSALFVGGMPIEPVLVTVYRFHRGNPADVVGLPPAQVSTWDYDDETGMARLVCASAAQMLERITPKLAVRRTCGWVLYDPDGCQVDPDDYTVSVVVLAVDAFTVTLDFEEPPATDWYVLGYIVTPEGRRLFITRQDGNTLTLLTRATSDVVVGAEVQVVAGCDRQIATCAAKFSNGLRFLGWPLLPVVNPFVDGVRQAGA